MDIAALHTLIRWSDVGVLVYFLALNAFYAMLLCLSVPQIWRHWETYKDDHLGHYLSTDALPSITIIAPAYNMEGSICDTTECLLSLQYPRHDIVIVNDGSNDSTLELLRRKYELYEVPPIFDRSIETAEVRGYYRSRLRPNLLIIDKENGGKSDAQNAGLCAARHSLVLFVDADTLIEDDALIRLARIFLLDADVVGAGATIRVANGCTVRSHTVEEARVPRSFFAGMQVPEYMRAFLFGRLGFNALGGNLIVSGAFGIFRKEHLLAIGGYRAGSVAEDLDLVLRLHKHLREQGKRYSIPFIPDPIAWTEVPTDPTTLGNQRERWHRGLIATLLPNFPMLLNPRYGRVGMITMPFFFFGEMLAPLIEAFGIFITLLGLYLGAINTSFALLFFAACWGYGMLITLAAVVMEEVTFSCYRRVGDFLRIVLFAILEPFGYRQLTVIWRLRSFWRALRGDNTWGAMKRHGFAGTDA